MSEHDGTGRNGVSYTVKELIAQVNDNVTHGLTLLGDRLDSIEAKLERKADRDRLHDLANAITSAEGRNLEARSSLDKRITLLEANTVKREGPLVNELRNTETRVLRLENGINLSIRQAIEENNRRLAGLSDRIFSRKERLALIALGSVGALSTIVSAVVFIFRLTH